MAWRSAAAGGNDVLNRQFGLARSSPAGAVTTSSPSDVVPATTDTNSITDSTNVTDHDHIAISASAFGSGLTPGMDTNSVFESSGDAEFFGSLFHYE